MIYSHHGTEKINNLMLNRALISHNKETLKNK